MTMFKDVEFTVREEFAELHVRLAKDRRLMGLFENDPERFLGHLRGSLFLKGSFGRSVDLCDIVVDAPLGTRFLTFDYCFSAIVSESDDPEIEPRIVLAGVNVVAVYNAGVMGNAIAYHDVLLGVELAI